jgi:hypothetical protein
MARERDFPASRKRGLESTTSWFLAMLALGVIAALLVVAVVPADNFQSWRVHDWGVEVTALSSESQNRPEDDLYVVARALRLAGLLAAMLLAKPRIDVVGTLSRDLAEQLASQRGQQVLVDHGIVATASAGLELRRHEFLTVFIDDLFELELGRCGDGGLEGGTRPSDAVANGTLFVACRSDCCC